jgi:REP element-mobilizing transposase RayT
MSNTYTQIHIQTVFSPQFYAALIDADWKDSLHKYMTVIIQNHGHKVLAINSMPDHLHIFFGMRPNESLSELMQFVKKDSSKWINTQGFCNPKFHWQEGFGGFSYSKWDVNKIIRYVLNQEEHHKKEKFLDEYRRLLKQFDVEYNEAYFQ